VQLPQIVFDGANVTGNTPYVLPHGLQRIIEVALDTIQLQLQPLLQLFLEHRRCRLHSLCDAIRSKAGCWCTRVRNFGLMCHLLFPEEVCRMAPQHVFVQILLRLKSLRTMRAFPGCSMDAVATPRSDHGCFSGGAATAT